jgi:hypothetical protein
MEEVRYDCEIPPAYDDDDVCCILPVKGARAELEGWLSMGSSRSFRSAKETTYQPLCETTLSQDGSGYKRTQTVIRVNQILLDSRASHVIIMLIWI